MRIFGRAIAWSVFGVVASAGLAIAALTFPALTGRVVDDAHMLSASTVQSLDAMLEAYERGSTQQVVVVTLPTLQGDEIADYGYQLGRYWGIGQKGKDNGVLLIVAPNEHKVRIEVGYGQEGTLTDSAANTIIQTVILPDFKNGRMEQGVVDGTRAILDTLGGTFDYQAVSPRQYTSQQATPFGVVCWLIFMIIFTFFLGRHPMLATFLLLNSSSRFGGSSMNSGWSGGGFSGGGGSFGGGGSSGSW